MMVMMVDVFFLATASVYSWWELLFPQKVTSVLIWRYLNKIELN